MSKKKLRDGFTTGSAATAAAMAALQIVLAQRGNVKILQEDHKFLLLDFAKNNPMFMDIPLPPQAEMGEKFLRIPINSICLINDKEAIATVKKDGGDDPDVTNNAFIEARLKLNQNCEQISLDGGDGVGRVTLPGLPLAVGEAAINPAPREQISAGISKIIAAYGYIGGVDICISVPDGAKIAKHTFNPRLGIVGGISILGTQGTVKPYSHDAWKATIAQGLQVAAANDCNTICLTTGRRSERLLQSKFMHLPRQCFVQVADFAKFSLSETAKYNFKQIEWACFFGKLVKLAQGHAYTHAHHALLDFDDLANFCLEYGLDTTAADCIRACVTANHALEIILNSAQHSLILQAIVRQAADIATSFAGRKVQMHLFHFDGRSLITI